MLQMASLSMYDLDDIYEHNILTTSTMKLGFW